MVCRAGSEDAVSVQTVFQATTGEDDTQAGGLGEREDKVIKLDNMNIFMAIICSLCKQENKRFEQIVVDVNPARVIKYKDIHGETTDCNMTVN